MSSPPGLPSHLQSFLPPPGPQRTVLGALTALSLAGAATRQARAAALSVGMQYLVFFVHAWPARSERLYDLSGAATHVALVVQALLRRDKPAGRATLLAVASVVWATRLGSFLFMRITRDGGVDHRFDAFKNVSMFAFLQAWTMQACWCWLVELPVLIAVAASSSVESNKLNLRDYLGAGLWTAGFALEVMADAQKNAFQFDPQNKGKFINTGLWRSFSRHPNMAGEILLWIGATLSASNTFRPYSTDYLAVLSPVFTYYLLTRVSGIPMLERASNKKWGHLPEYQEYLAQTPVLFPFWV